MDDVTFNQMLVGSKSDKPGDWYEVFTELSYPTPGPLYNVWSLLVNIHVKREALNVMTQIRKSFVKVVFLM